MPLYNEETLVDNVSKTKYERSYQAVLNNFVGEVPEIQFKTAWVLRDNNTGSEEQLDYKRTLTSEYDPAEVFNVIDQDGNVLDQATYGQVFALMYSLFFHVANKEDANG